MRAHSDLYSIPQPNQLVGAVCRFGPTGPVYQVLAVGPPAGSNDRLMRIRIVETGEELDYRLTEILDDPDEA